jgi:hypothetical protein
MSDAEDQRSETLLQQNLAELLRALRDLGVRQVEVAYAGSRGRYRQWTIALLPVETRARLRQTLVIHHRHAADAGQPAATFTESISLSEALLRFTQHWTSLKFGYWQRGDGGRGVMRILVDEGALTLDHDAHLVEAYHTTLHE